MKNEWTLGRATTLAEIDAVQAIIAEDKVLDPIPVSYIRGMAHTFLVVARKDGEVIGFAHYKHRADRITALLAIGVKKEWRRLGVGAMLMEQVKDEALALGQKRMRLHCPNEEANGFFEELGFYGLLETERGLVWEKRIP